METNQSDPSFISDMKSLETEPLKSGIGAKILPANPWSTVFSKSVNPLNVLQKSAICVLYKAKSVDLWTCSPHQFATSSP